MSNSGGNAFALHGTREIIESTDALPVIEELLETLERAVESGSPMAFELSKALIDSMCKTILIDRGIEINSRWDTPQFIRNTLDNLSFIPENHPDGRRFRERITKTLQALAQAVDGLYDLRNQDGIVAHGIDASQEIRYTFQTELAARASDAIIPFLYKAHKQLPSDLVGGRIYYADFPEFNEHLDSANETIEIAGMAFSPSWTIYTSDKEHKTYRELLVEYELYKEEEIGEPVV
jgi:hypothetical protein